MIHLQISPHCDCKYPITWVLENIKFCYMNREYKERHEPAYDGVAIRVQLPESDMYAEFAVGEDGWIYVSDCGAETTEKLVKVPTVAGIAEVELNAKEVEKTLDYMQEKLMLEERFGMTEGDIRLAVYTDAFGDAKLDTEEEHKTNLAILDDAVTFLDNGAAIDVVAALFERGSLFDGDIPSKSGRDALLEKDYVAKVIQKGEWGYNALTYKGGWLNKCLEAFRKLERKTNSKIN